MLSHLSISNYALIEKLEISFSEGLSIITGETGAGKSILLGALSLVLGQRADTQVLYDKSKKCFVEATFRIKGYGLQVFFEAHELDYDDNVILRREVNPNGKSRAFINDTPVTLDLMKELGNILVDVHSQHKTLMLQDSHFQLSFIDSYAQHQSLLDNFSKEFQQNKKLKSELGALVETEKKALSDKDYIQFQYDEINAANLINGEQKELESELGLLNHAEEIKLNLGKAITALSEGESNLCSGLSDALLILNKTSAIYPELSDVVKRLESCNIELKDISGEVEILSQKINYNPGRIGEITERLDLIYHLQQKHRVGTIEELLTMKDFYSEKLEVITSLDQHIAQLREKITSSEKSLSQLSGKITNGRKKTIPCIEKGITDIVHTLAIPDATFSIESKELPEYNSLGKDKVTFMFNANKGRERKELSKTASGGELSRLMLAVKSLISERKLLPTIIFDEIDQGVSGETADKVGNILKKMSATMQVVTITHLPQIACKGTSHFLVYKESDQKSAFTKIKLLDTKERIIEIAKMLSGDELTKAAVDNAKALLKN
ncbi:MAG: DNA repair protein RecN [Bacteroidota bacterium]